MFDYIEQRGEPSPVIEDGSLPANLVLTVERKLIFATATRYLLKVD